MSLYGKACVTVTKLVGIFQNEKNALAHGGALTHTPAHTHVQGDNILSFGNHRLTQQGLVSAQRPFFQKP